MFATPTKIAISIAYQAWKFATKEAELCCGLNHLSRTALLNTTEYIRELAPQFGLTLEIDTVDGPSDDAIAYLPPFL